MHRGVFDLYKKPASAGFCRAFFCYTWQQLSALQERIMRVLREHLQPAPSTG